MALSGLSSIDRRNSRSAPAQSQSKKKAHMARDVCASLSELSSARTAAEKALALDSSLSEAHTSLAMCAFFFDWDWAGAEREFRRSMELSPDNAMAHRNYA